MSLFTVFVYLIKEKREPKVFPLIKNKSSSSLAHSGSSHLLAIASLVFWNS